MARLQNGIETKKHCQNFLSDEQGVRTLQTSETTDRQQTELRWYIPECNAQCSHVQEKSEQHNSKSTKNIHDKTPITIQQKVNATLVSATHLAFTVLQKLTVADSLV